MSFCMLIDKYPDTLHKKIQTAIFIINAFSKAINTSHIPKISVFTPLYEHQLRPGRLSLAGRPHCTLCTHTILSPLCLTAFSGQFEGLTEDFHDKWLYGLINRKSLKAMVQCWPGPSIMTLTMSLQLSVTKVTFAGAIKWLTAIVYNS